MTNQTLQIGQRVYTNLYAKGFGSVYAIHGDQQPQTIRSLAGGAMVTGGRASFDIVFDNGTTSAQLPESILHGIQWQILWDEPLATPFEMSDALERAEAVKTEKEHAEIERQMLLEKRRREQEVEFSHLTRATNEKPSSAKLGAANIRTELKAAFPGIKFSVKTRNYAGGCSIDVEWQDGPTGSLVEAITNKYQEGHFNGMEDIYESNRNNVFTPVFGGAKYVGTTRSYSREFLEAVATKTARKWGQPVPTVRVSEYSGAWIDRDGLKPLTSWDFSSTIDRDIMKDAAKTDARPKARLRFNWETKQLVPA